MGGTVGVTIRRADGREHRMARWTNPLGHIFLNLKFIEGEDSFFDEYISMWDDMREDWLDNHRTKQFRHDMTPCYGDWPYLAPVSYGLVVIDYKTKTILHSQGYSSMVEFHASDFLREPIYAGLDQWPEPKTLALCKSGRVMRAKWDDGTEEFMPAGTLTGWEEEVTRLEETTDGSVNARWSSRYVVDINPWKVERFGEDGTDIVAMKNRLEELGFAITDEEEAHWGDFIAEHTYDEEE